MRLPSHQFIALSALATIAACSCGPTSTVTTPANPAPVTATPSADPRGWHVTFTIDRSGVINYAPELSATLTVVGPLSIPTGCGVNYGLNVWLEDSSGHRVTPQRVQNFACVAPPPGGYQPKIIPPGQAATFTDTITCERSDGSVLPSGTYTLHGTLSTNPLSEIPVVTVNL